MIYILEISYLAYGWIINQHGLMRAYISYFIWKLVVILLYWILPEINRFVTLQKK